MLWIPTPQPGTPSREALTGISEVLQAAGGSAGSPLDTKAKVWYTWGAGRARQARAPVGIPLPLQTHV